MKDQHPQQPFTLSQPLPCNFFNNFDLSLSLRSIRNVQKREKGRNIPHNFYLER